MIVSNQWIPFIISGWNEDGRGSSVHTSPIMCTELCYNMRMIHCLIINIIRDYCIFSYTVLFTGVLNIWQVQYQQINIGYFFFLFPKQLTRTCTNLCLIFIYVKQEDKYSRDRFIYIVNPSLYMWWYVILVTTVLSSFVSDIYRPYHKRYRNIFCVRDWLLLLL